MGVVTQTKPNQTTNHKTKLSALRSLLVVNAEGVLAHPQAHPELQLELPPELGLGPEPDRITQVC